MKRIVAVTLVAAFGLSACEYVPFTPQNAIATAKARVAINSANPHTVQWSDVKEYRGAVCGVFNAQEAGYPVRSELTWTGPLNFITIKGDPFVVTNDSECDSQVDAWSRCHNQGDEAKVKLDVEACKVFQAKALVQYGEVVADRMASTGLAATGDPDRDQASWDAYYKAARIAAHSSYNDPAARVRWAAGNKWKAEYNRVMRLIPRGAAEAQKVAQAVQAEAAATALSEAYLAENGVV
jgi:hypothetical protein